jgi:hypothetical protein
MRGVSGAVGGLVLGAALLALLLAAPLSAPFPVARAAVPAWVLPRGEVVARTERRLSPPGRGPVVAKLTTWAALQPVVAGRRGSHSSALTADPDRWLWALLIDTRGDPSEPGAVIAVDAGSGEWLGAFGPQGDPKGLPERLRLEQRTARRLWDRLADRAGSDRR